MVLSLVMIGLQAVLTVGLILLMRRLGWPEMWQATAPAIALALALAFAAISKARLLSRLLEAPVSGWRWPIMWATGAAAAVGQLAILLPEWAELAIGIPAILAAFGAVIWVKGFGPEDRELFRMRKSDIAELSEAELPALGTTSEPVR
jgi:hypothetical protein